MHKVWGRFIFLYFCYFTSSLRKYFYTHRLSKTHISFVYLKQHHECIHIYLVLLLHRNFHLLFSDFSPLPLCSCSSSSQLNWIMIFSTCYAFPTIAVALDASRASAVQCTKLLQLHKLKHNNFDHFELEQIHKSISNRFRTAEKENWTYEILFCYFSLRIKS